MLCIAAVNTVSSLYII